MMLHPKTQRRFGKGDTKMGNATSQCITKGVSMVVERRTFDDFFCHLGTQSSPVLWMQDLLFSPNKPSEQPPGVLRRCKKQSQKKPAKAGSSQASGRQKIHVLACYHAFFYNGRAQTKRRMQHRNGLWTMPGKTAVSMTA